MGLPAHPAGLPTSRPELPLPALWAEDVAASATTLAHQVVQHPGITCEECDQEATGRAEG
jgi:hypothetical protein